MLEGRISPSQQSQIAVFFSKGIDKQHIGFNLLSVLGQELSRKNYSISIFHPGSRISVSSASSYLPFGTDSFHLLH